MFMEWGISFWSGDCIVAVEKSGGSMKLNRYKDLEKAERQGGIIMTFRSPCNKIFMTDKITNQNCGGTFR